MAAKNISATYDYTVSTRDDLDGPDLTSNSQPPNVFPTDNFSWIEFDFEDISVTPGSTYYIVSYTENVTDNWYGWGMKVGDVYPDGTVYYTTNEGVLWEEKPDGDMTFKTYGQDNSALETPTITGETNGKTGKTYTFCTDTAVDPDGDDIYVYWHWGDGSNSGWLGPYSSGEQICADHSWSEDGTYIIKAKLKDDYGAESDWGTLSVTMPFSYNMNQQSSTPLFFRILQRLINTK